MLTVESSYSIDFENIESFMGDEIIGNLLGKCYNILKNNTLTADLK